MKMSATMVDQRRKISKLYWIKCHKTVTQKKKFGAENNWLKTSYLQFIAINFRFSGRKSQSQQQLVDHSFYNTVAPLDETHLDAVRGLILPRGFHPAHHQVE